MAGLLTLQEIDDDVLNQMRDALLTVDENVFFGSASRLPKDADWSFTVLRRVPSNHNGNGTAIGIKYEVTVVRPGSVPLNLIPKVKNAMCSIPGVRWSETNSLSYDYAVKPGTSDTYESMTMTFTKALRV
ncbi:MAG: hypothetical protein ACI4BI_01825 [Anaerotardibacter sp.]